MAVGCRHAEPEVSAPHEPIREPVATGAGAPTSGTEPAAADAAVGATTPSPANPALAAGAEGVAEEPPPTPPEQAGWRHAPPETDLQRALVAAAEAQRDIAARGLMSALVTATSGGDFAGAIDACRLAAPAATEAAQRPTGDIVVAVGRTSDRLRNPENVAPEWVRAALLTDDPAGVWLGPDMVGVLTPIPTASLCVSCHGPADRLASGVAAALAAAYPSDRATGFAEGDTRGWFWAEAVPNL